MNLPTEVVDTLNLFTHKNYRYSHEFSLDEVRLMRLCLMRVRSEYRGLKTIENQIERTARFLNDIEKRD